MLGDTEGDPCKNHISDTGIRAPEDCCLAGRAQESAAEQQSSLTNGRVIQNNGKDDDEDRAESEHFKANEEWNNQWQDVEPLNSEVISLDRETEEYLSYVHKEAESLSQHHRQSVVPTACPVESLKKRCVYIDYLLRLDTLGNSCRVSPPSYKKIDKGHIASTSWEQIILHYFCRFRYRIKHIAKVSPFLMGESLTPSYTPRDWDLCKWKDTILNSDVGVAVLGVCDSVKCTSVLEAVASLLSAHIKLLKQRLSATTSTAIDTDDDPSLLSNNQLQRVLHWTCASLLSLHRLHAVDADVSYTLQRVRRGCCWLQVHQEIHLTNTLQSGLRLIEVVIENYFEQR